MMGGVKVKYHENEEDLKYIYIVTHDDSPRGYASSYILIHHPKQLWGFHLLWLQIDGELKSATSAMPITLGRHKETDFGQKFLETFSLVLERNTGDSQVLGKIPEMQKQPGWKGIGTINAILCFVYEKMWDLGVKVTEFKDIPSDVIRDYRQILKATPKPTL
jgi:hypothetical protein